VLVNSALISNTAYRVGGGLVNFLGSAEASNVTFSTNTAEDGGGVWNDEGTLRLAFVTFAGNIADTASAIWNYTTYPAATLYLEATLLAGNGPGYNCHAQPGSLPIQSGGYNLSDDRSFVPGIGVCPSFGVTDLSDTAPMLGPLSESSGPMPFHPLLGGSPAIDAIPVGSPGNRACGTTLTYDQLDFPRPMDGDGNGVPRCDIGAIEAALQLWLPLIVR